MKVILTLTLLFTVDGWSNSLGKYNIKQAGYFDFMNNLQRYDQNCNNGETMIHPFIRDKMCETFRKFINEWFVGY